MKIQTEYASKPLLANILTTQTKRLKQDIMINIMATYLIVWLHCTAPDRCAQNFYSESKILFFILYKSPVLGNILELLYSLITNLYLGPAFKLGLLCNTGVAVAVPLLWLRFTPWVQCFRLLVHFYVPARLDSLRHLKPSALCCCWCAVHSLTVLPNIWLKGL